MSKNPDKEISSYHAHIYFSAETKAQLVDRFADQLVAGGLLIMGHSESLYRSSDRFEALGKTIYRLIDNGCAS